MSTSLPERRFVERAQLAAVKAGAFGPQQFAGRRADGEVAGTVSDLWIDTAEMMFRYVEIDLANGGRRVLMPINFARIKAHGLFVYALMAHQFGNVPATKSAQEITLLEEEKIMAYFGAGLLYAEPSRLEPPL